MAGKSEVVLPVLKHQTIKIYGVEVKLHVFLTTGITSCQASLCAISTK